MTLEMHDLDLIDLLSERHLLLRKTLGKMWQDHIDPNLTITNTEWFIMAKIQEANPPTLSHVTKQVDISRQAVHKSVKSLEKKGLVDITNSHGNKIKGLQLTELGKEYYKKIITMKTELEKIIVRNLGEENVGLLKKLLKSDWGIESLQ